MKLILKKLFLGCCSVVLLVQWIWFASQLTAEQKQRVWSASSVLALIMKTYNLSAQEFVDVIAPFREQYADNDQKIAFIDAVESETLDVFFGVDDFALCTSYFDGCNICWKEVGGYLMACTKKACLQTEEPECRSYESYPICWRRSRSDLWTRVMKVARPTTRMWTNRSEILWWIWWSIWWLWIIV